MFALLAVALLPRTPVSAEAPLPPPATTEFSEPIVPIPPSRPLDSNRVTLGQQLFQDARLSRDRGRSCATCHPVERGGMDGRTRAFTANGDLNVRNTPTIFNVGLSAFLNWDGIADTLERQAALVLRNPSVMDMTWPELLSRLSAAPEYVSGFGAVYYDGLTQQNVLDALATYERSLETPDSRFDQFLRGDRTALSEPERRGYALFKSYGCAACHQGVNIGGNMFQKFGVFTERGVQFLSIDLGRYLVTGVARDRGVFRVPSLRNVAVTAPYFHDGRAASLEAAVDTMAKFQLGRAIRPDENSLIVQFLQTLTGRYHGQLIGPRQPPGR